MATYDEALAQVTGPGQVFEITDSAGPGPSSRRYANAPATLKTFFDQLRGDDRVFIAYEGEEWSFSRVKDEIDALGATLVHRYGIAVGDRVGIAMRNLPEWIVAFGAILSVGAVSVSLNAWWTPDELDYAIGDADPRLVLVDGQRVERIAAIAERRGLPVIVARADGVALPAGMEHWHDVVIPGAELPLVDFDGSSDATILYTSGTTGQPKGAVSTHDAVSQAVIAFGADSSIYELVRGPRASSGLAPCFILVVPLFHVTGCVPVMMSCVAWHFKMVIMYRWDPEQALELIEKHRVTRFVGVPTQVWDLMESPRFADFDTSSLSLVGGGGAPAPPALVARVGHAFVRGLPSLGYGMTETNAYGPGNVGTEYESHPTSTGRAHGPVMDASIRDPQGAEVAPGERGEIWLRGPTLIRGYWNRPQDTEAALYEGWLRTGDVGHVDAEGFLYIEDRAKDLILRAGENVYSAEVESALYALSAVYEAAVFALPNERLGEEVACVVRLREGMSLTADELRDQLAEHLAAYKIPTRVAFTSEPLPRNPAGKLLKRSMPGLYFSAASDKAARA
ncbi:MAG: class I adenylate-forming enzyme family protein [Acidimicrobiales bacterium]